MEAGINGAFFGGLEGMITGGFLGGVEAGLAGRNVWTGAEKMVPVTPLDRVEPTGVANIKKASNFSPYIKGKEGVQMAEQEFVESGGTVLSQEVTIKVVGGEKTIRPDFVGEKDGIIYVYEVKNGPKASFTPNQKVNIPKLFEPGASFIPIGKNAAEIKQFAPFETTRTPYTGNFIFVYKHYW
jgi:hypothetical protein